MLRFLLRTIAVFCLALSVMFVVIDATRSVGVSQIIVTMLSDSWIQFMPETFAAFTLWAEQSAPAFVNDPLLATVLKWPTFLVFAGLAALFYALGYKRRRKPGYMFEN